MKQLEYKIEGSDLQLVGITLEPGESMVAEPGAMMYVDQDVALDTRMGDGSEDGFFGRLASGFKRAFTGENFFTTVFTNPAAQPRRVALAAPSPGKIVPVDLDAVGGTFICQKGAYLGGSRGVRLGLAFKKRLRAGFLGGEGFIMQKLTGSGTVFIHASGTLTTIQLKPGEGLRVDTGCLAALQPSVSYDVRYVGKLKTSILGGEGLFFAELRGPGTVWLQSLPMKRLRASILGGSTGQRRGMGGLFYLGFVIFIVIMTLIRTGGV